MHSGQVRKNINEQVKCHRAALHQPSSSWIFRNAQSIRNNLIHDLSLYHLCIIMLCSGFKSWLIFCIVSQATKKRIDKKCFWLSNFFISFSTKLLVSFWRFASQFRQQVSVKSVCYPVHFTCYLNYGWVWWDGRDAHAIQCAAAVDHGHAARSNRALRRGSADAGYGGGAAPEQGSGSNLAHDAKAAKGGAAARVSDVGLACFLSSMPMAY